MSGRFERLARLISEIESLAGESAGSGRLAQALAEAKCEVRRLEVVCPDDVRLGHPADPGYADPPVLDREFVLRQYPSGLGVYARLVALFSADAGVKASRIREHLEAGRAGEACRLAHSLVGITATLGATRASQASRRLERLLKAGRNGEEAVLLLDRAQSEAEQAVEAMKRLLDEETAQA